MPTIIDRLRRMWSGPPTSGSGVGIFTMNGQQGITIGQSWDFLRIANSVYANPTGYRCVEAIAANLSRPSWMILPVGTDWPELSSEVKAIKDHALLSVLNRPNVSMSATQMQRAIARDLELTGKSFWVKMQGSDGYGLKGPVTGLRRLPPQRVTVVGNQDDELLGFVYTDRNGMQSAVLPDALVYLRYPHPERIFDGMAPGLVAGLPAETDTAGARFNRDLLASDGAVPGYLILEGLTPDQFAEWRQEWESKALPGKTRFLRGSDAKYVRAGMTNQELTYAALREDSQDDIMRAFGVPRAVAFDVTHEALALDTRLPTPDGWVSVGDVQVGDVLFDEAGNPTNVTATTPVYESRDCYAIEFSGGVRVVADAGHLWRTRVDLTVQLQTTAQLFSSGERHWIDDTVPGAVRSRRILTVMPVPSVPVRCIEVDSPSHLFLCTASWIPTHNTYANAEREQAIFMQHNILPKWVLIADEMTLQLGQDDGVRVAFDLAHVDELQDSRDAIVDRATKMLSYKVQTINEFRRTQGWEDVKWGDEPVAPLQPMSAVPLQPGGEPGGAAPAAPGALPAKSATNGKARTNGAPKAADALEALEGDLVALGPQVLALEQAYSPTQPRDDHGRWGTTGTPHGLPAMGTSVEGELVSSVRKSGGFTYHAKQGISPVGGGYMVSPYGQHERVIDGKRFGKHHLADYASEHRDLLAKPDHFLGAWASDGKVYLDVAVRVMDRGAAVQLAKKHKQLAIWDLKNGSEVDTREPGKQAAGDPDRSVASGDGRRVGRSVRGDPENVGNGLRGSGDDLEQIQQELLDLEVAYSATQPRIPSGPGGGRWSSGGGGGSDAHALLRPEIAARAEMVASKLQASKGQSTDLIYEHNPAAPGKWSVEREAIHEQIVQEVLDENSHVPRDGQAIIMGGIGGSGKTTVLTSELGPKFGVKVAAKPSGTREGGGGIDNFMMVNADDINERMMRKGYAPKIPPLSPMETSPLLYIEAVHIANRIGDRAIHERRNVIWDVTLGSQTSGVERIAGLRKQGYKITGIFVDVPISQSISAAMKRYQKGVDAHAKGQGEGGRYVPPKLIEAGRDGKKYNSKNAQAFADMHHQFDKWFLIDNTNFQRKLVASG